MGNFSGKVCKPVMQQWQDAMRLGLVEIQTSNRKDTPVDICGFIQIDQGSEDLVGGQGIQVSWNY
jgi:hypothetical protein